MAMSRLSAGLVAPRLFSASAIAFASKAALFQVAAQVPPDRNRPATPTDATAAALPASFSKDLRRLFMIHRPLHCRRGAATKVPHKLSTMRNNGGTARAANLAKNAGIVHPPP